MERLRPNTISCYVRDAYRLGEHSGWIHPSKLSANDVRCYIDWLTGRVQPLTVTVAQLCLRGFIRFLVDEREIRRGPSTKIKLIRCKFDIVSTGALSSERTVDGRYVTWGGRPCILHTLPRCNSSLILWQTCDFPESQSSRLLDQNWSFH